MRNGQDQDNVQNIPTDAASLNYSSNTDGWATCGARTYAITDSTGATPTWVTAVTEIDTANS